MLKRIITAMTWVLTCITLVVFLEVLTFILVEQLTTCNMAPAPYRLGILERNNPVSFVTPICFSLHFVEAVSRIRNPWIYRANSSNAPQSLVPIHKSADGA